MPTLLRWTSFWIALIVSLPVALGQSPAEPARQVPAAETVHPAWQSFAPEFTPYVCPFQASAPAYDPEEFRCGYVLVPEDRTDPASRLIKLSVLRIASTSNSPPAGAIIRLTGGPGGPSLSAGRIRAYQNNPGTQRFRNAADLIFFDQRGIGYSEAAFCRAVPRNFQYGVRTLPDGENKLIAAFRKCLAEAEAQGIATDAYSTWQNALDVRDIRRALGYDQWTLFGVSYGTQLAQAVIEVDEPGIRAAILDSVVPASPLEQGGWTAAAYGFRSALSALQTDCADNAACARDIGDISQRFIDALATYDADPMVIEGMNPGSYIDGRLVLDGVSAGGAVFQALYRRDLYKDMPSLLKALETRDAEAIKAYADVLGRRIEHGAGNGMELVANCRGSGLITPEARERMIAEEPQLSKWTRTVEWTDICAATIGARPDPAVTPLITDVPILIGAGTGDPITPPEYGESLLPNLANATYAEFPHTGHGVFLTHLSGCGGDILLAFATAPERPVDTRCTSAISAPEFLTQLKDGSGPYQFALRLQRGDYPHGLIAAALTACLALIMLPLGWLARRIEAHGAPDLAGARPLIWTGALISLIGLSWAIHMTLRTATAHPMALPVGVLPAAGWAGWLTLAGLALAAFGLFRMLTRLGGALQRPGTFIGLILTSLAVLAICIFVSSLGLGPI